MPPAFPGLDYVRIISWTAIVAGDVSSFDISAFITGLANLTGVAKDSISAATSAASVNVQANLTVADDALVANVVSSLGASPASLSASLGVAVEASNAPQLLLVLGEPPAAPPTEDVPAIVGGVVGGVLGAFALAGLAYVYLKTPKEPEGGHREAAAPQAQVV